MQVFQKFVSNSFYSVQIYLGKCMPSTFKKFLLEHLSLTKTSHYKAIILQNKNENKKTIFEIKFYDLVLEPPPTVHGKQI